MKDGVSTQRLARPGDMHLALVINSELWLRRIRSVVRDVDDWPQRALLVVRGSEINVAGSKICPGDVHGSIRRSCQLRADRGWHCGMNGNGAAECGTVVVRSSEEYVVAIAFVACVRSVGSEFLPGNVHGMAARDDDVVVSLTGKRGQRPRRGKPLQMLVGPRKK